MNCVYLIRVNKSGHQYLSDIFLCVALFRSGTLQQQTNASAAGAQALHLSVLFAVVYLCDCDPCDTTYFLELWRIRWVLMLYCSSVPLLLSLFEPNKYLLLLLLRQTTFNSLRFICWVLLCCLIAQNIFVHSRIHCSCYTLLDAVTQTSSARFMSP